jgi:hypothetical protein
MDAPIRVRRGRKFPPRIPKEELNERVSVRLSACGVQNNLQAQYEASAAKVAQTLTDPRFESLKANLKLTRKTKAWKTAFSVVFAYLNEFSMKATHDTIHVEAQNKDFPKDESAFDASRASDYLANLVENANSFTDHDNRFAEAVKEFAGEPIGQRQPLRSASPKERSSSARLSPEKEGDEGQYEYEEEEDVDVKPVKKVTPKLTGNSGLNQFDDRLSGSDGEKSDSVQELKIGSGEEEDEAVHQDFDAFEDFDS